jgi:hypothetical protein
VVPELATTSSQAQSNDAYINRIEKGCFHGSNDKFRCAVWLARVSNHGIVEIYAAFRHMRRNPALGSLTRDKCNVTGWWSSRAVGRLETEAINSDIT